MLNQLNPEEEKTYFKASSLEIKTEGKIVKMCLSVIKSNQPSTFIVIYLQI